MAGYVYSGLSRVWPSPTGQKVAAFCGGALGVMGAGLLPAVALAFSEEGFATAARLLFLAHLPVMIAEGLITMITVGFIAKVRLKCCASRLPKTQGFSCFSPANAWRQMLYH